MLTQARAARGLASANTMSYPPGKERRADSPPRPVCAVLPRVLGASLALALLAPPAGHAQDPDATPVMSWETGAGRSYAVPALEIFGFDALLNGFDRLEERPNVYDTNWSSIRHNLTHSWVFDNDPFSTNQFLHPYQGSMYHGFARSAGLSYWESAGYTFAGSLLWETAGETTTPSKNDQVASGIAGAFFGEPLFRMSSLLLERGDALPRFWRELAAAAISPSTGFNRLAFGDRFDTIFPSHDPAFFTRVRLGESLTTLAQKGVSRSLIRNEVLLDFSMDYGLPGKPGYTYTRPFDYFNFQFTAASGNVFENIMTHGLLVGREYDAGNAYRGVWGLYGSYDYIAPQVFRVSSTAVSLGTTAQWWLARSVALQGTALLGAGYGAAGTIHGVGERDYHYGLTPQMLLSGKLIMDKRAALELSARDYYVSRVASPENRGWENIARATASFTWRVHGPHAITANYTYSRREADYPDLGDRVQARATAGLFYTFLGDERFGAVDWRGQSPDTP